MSYAGDLTPRETYRLLADDPRALLVDVRTRAELTYVGLPDLREISKRVLLVEWQRFPDGTTNPSFLRELADAGASADNPVAFICRSGHRSRSAAQAATAAGYHRAYNVSEGFEGDLDANGHRGLAGGWKVADLPWRQT